MCTRQQASEVAKTIASALARLANFLENMSRSPSERKLGAGIDMANYLVAAMERAAPLHCGRK